MGRGRLHAGARRHRDHGRRVRRPLRPQAAVHRRPHALHRHLAACAAAQSITMLNLARAAQGVGGAAMFAVSLAVLSQAFPDIRQRVQAALAAYGATMAGAFSVGPLVGGALTSGLRLALDLPARIRRSAWPAWPSCAAWCGNPRTRRHRGWTCPGWSLTRRPVPARLRAPARQRGRLGQRGDRRGLRRRRRAARRVRGHRGAEPARSPCCRCACSEIRRSPARRSPRSGSPARCSRCGCT